MGAAVDVGRGSHTTWSIVVKTSDSGQGKALCFSTVGSDEENRSGIASTTEPRRGFEGRERTLQRAAGTASLAALSRVRARLFGGGVVGGRRGEASWGAVSVGW